GLPPIDARAPFDPKVLFRGVREAVGDHGVDGAPEGPWSPMAVDEPPVLLAGPPLGYPDMLRRTGTTGTVVVQIVIDTLGRPEPRSLVLESSHVGFEGAARAYVLGALFRPGRTHGRAVRVLVRTPRPEQGAQHVCRSEEHTSELQSRGHLVCRLLLEKKK